MANPFPASFESLQGARRLTGQVNFTDPANQPTAASSIGGVTVSGTPSAGQVLTATSAAAADWEAGATPPVGVYAALSGSATLSSAATVPFNTANFDPAGYLDAVNHRLVVPAGHAGLTLIGFLLFVDGPAAGTFARGTINNSGNDANLIVGLPQWATVGATKPWAGSGLLLVNAAVGDTYTLTVAFDGGGTSSITGGGNGSVLWATRLAA